MLKTGCQISCLHVHRLGQRWRKQRTLCSASSRRGVRGHPVPLLIFLVARGQMRWVRTHFAVRTWASVLTLPPPKCTTLGNTNAPGLFSHLPNHPPHPHSPPPPDDTPFRQVHCKDRDGLYETFCKLHHFIETGSANGLQSLGILSLMFKDSTNHLSQKARLPMLPQCGAAQYSSRWPREPTERQAEICCKWEIHTRFEGLLQKEECQISHSYFYIDYTWKWQYFDKSGWRKCIIKADCTYFIPFLLMWLLDLKLCLCPHSHPSGYPTSLPCCIFSFSGARCKTAGPLGQGVWLYQAVKPLASVFQLLESCPEVRTHPATSFLAFCPWNFCWQFLGFLWRVSFKTSIPEIFRILEPMTELSVTSWIGCPKKMFLSSHFCYWCLRP